MELIYHNQGDEFINHPFFSFLDFRISYHMCDDCFLIIISTIMIDSTTIPTLRKTVIEGKVKIGPLISGVVMGVV